MSDKQVTSDMIWLIYRYPLLYYLCKLTHITDMYGVVQLSSSQ